MLPAAARLRRTADFTATLRAARVRRGDGIVVLHVASPGTPGTPDTPDSSDAGPGTRVGFVVPRAVGTAVTRNRVRRRLRHLLRDRLHRLPAGSRVVVRVLPPAAAASPARLTRALDRALGREVTR